MSNIEIIHYAMANMKFPIIRKPDGSFDSLTEFMTIELEKITEIPPKPDYKLNNEIIKQKLNELFSKPEPLPPIGNSEKHRLIIKSTDIHIESDDILYTETEVVHTLDEIHNNSSINNENESSTDDVIREPIDEEEKIVEMSYNNDEMVSTRFRNLGAKLLNAESKHKKKYKRKDREPSPDVQMRGSNKK